MPFVSFLEDQDGMGEIIRQLPESLGPFLEMTQAVMRGESAFTPAQREIIGAYVSAANNCNFCYNSHAATAAAFGVELSLFESLIEDLDQAPVDNRLKPVLRYVKKLTETPYKMVQADADAVYAAGWDEKALSDAVLICGLFNMANRVVEGHGVDRELPQEIFDQGGKHLMANGYLPPK